MFLFICCCSPTCHNGVWIICDSHEITDWRKKTLESNTLLLEKLKINGELFGR